MSHSATDHTLLIDDKKRRKVEQKMADADAFAIRVAPPRFVVMRLWTPAVFALIFACLLWIPYRALQLFSSGESAVWGFVFTAFLNAGITLGAVVLLVAALTTRKIAALDAALEEHRPYFGLGERFEIETMTIKALKGLVPSAEQKDKLEVAEYELESHLPRGSQCL